MLTSIVTESLSAVVVSVEPVVSVVPYAPTSALTCKNRRRHSLITNITTKLAFSRPFIQQATLV